MPKKISDQRKRELLSSVAKADGIYYYDSKQPWHKDMVALSLENYIHLFVDRSGICKVILFDKGIMFLKTGKSE